MWKLIADIAEFHEKFGLEYQGPPRAVPMDLAEFRTKFMMEEAHEYATENAMALTSPRTDQAEYTHHLEEILDAFVDLIYVTLGTAYMHGMGPMMQEAWDRVHKANMSKVRATHASQSKRGSTFDVVKPPGWEPPSHTDLVEKNDRT